MRPRRPRRGGRALVRHGEHHDARLLAAFLRDFDAAAVRNKREDATGATIKFTIALKNGTSPNCEPDFGALVSPTDNSTDWGFPHPPTFPGEW